MTRSSEVGAGTTYRPDEVLHELRGTVAGIAAATRVLRQTRAQHERPVERRLGNMLESEIARLDRLLGADCRSRDRAAALNAVISEVALCHRIRGVDVRWQSRRCGTVTRQWDVREALHILLDNAVRHAPGSPVTITAERVDRWAVVTVADGGPGVAAELADRIFERGVRHADSPGQGLGLHLARRLLVGIGGDLRLDEDFTGGARFELRIPVGRRS